MINSESDAFTDVSQNIQCAATMAVWMIRATRSNPDSDHFRESGIWVRRTLTSYLNEATERWPDRLAVVDGHTRLDYSTLVQETIRVALGLRRLGLERGQVVSYILPNWSEAVLFHHAVNSLGLINNPITPIYRHTELSFIASQAQPSLLVAPHRFRGFDYAQMLAELRSEGTYAGPVVIVRPQGRLPSGFLTIDDLRVKLRAGDALVDRSEASEICLLLYTSGTTADPKGVMHSHESLVYENRSIIELMNLDSDDRVFMPSPLTHIAGLLFGMQLPTILGTSVALLDEWNPSKGVDVIEREHCRFTVAATPFLHGLVLEYEKRAIRSSLRVFACGGADVPPGLIRRARSVMGASVMRVYGSSEFPTYSCSAPDAPESNAAETDGRPIGYAHGRILDDSGHDAELGVVGELAVAGPELFSGYLAPQLNSSFTPDGFFRTGDLASLDADGYITIMGRKKDIIIRGGEKISAKEVEDLLSEHSAIQEVAAVAMPDAALGEKVCVYVVPVRGASIDLLEISRYLIGRRIARQKFPERLELVEALPRTTSGKIQKFKLREDVISKIASEKPS